MIRNQNPGACDTRPAFPVELCPAMGVAPDFLCPRRRHLSEGDAAAMDSDKPVVGGGKEFRRSSPQVPPHRDVGADHRVLHEDHAV